MRFRFQQLLLGLTAAALAVVGATCGSNLTQQDGKENVGKEGAAAASLATGEELYQRYCALCHGKAGEGYAADNANALANQQFLATASDAFLRVAIVRGRVGTPMSAWGKQFGGPLSGPEVEKLVEHIRGWQTAPTRELPNGRVAGDVGRGKPLYDEHCASCHGPSGEGKLAPSLNNAIFHSTASDHFIRYAIAEGRTGTPMPAFQKSLGPQGVDDLTAYVRSLRKDGERKPPREAPVHQGPLVINPDGKPPKFELRDDFYVPAAQVKAALDSGARLVIADARAESDYLEAHIPGAIPMPFYAVEQYATKLPKDGTWIVAYCACPHAASGRVAHALRERGFKNAVVLDEGVLVWMQRGYPVTKPE